MLTSKAKSFKFVQITKALMALIENIEGKFHEYDSDIPVFLLTSGDNNVYFNKKFQEQSKEVYEKVPRVVLRIDSITEETDSRTAVYNKLQFYSEDDNKNCDAVVRRLQLAANLNLDIITSNFIDALMYMEIGMGIITRANAFTYPFHDSVYHSAFSCDTAGDLKFPEFDAGTRNYTNTYPIKQEIHLFVPRIETIQDTLPVKAIIDINGKDQLNILGDSEKEIKKYLDDPEVLKSVMKSLKIRGIEPTMENAIKFIKIDDSILEESINFDEKTVIDIPIQ